MSADILKTLKSKNLNSYTSMARQKIWFPSKEFCFKVLTYNVESQKDQKKHRKIVVSAHSRASAVCKWKNRVCASTGTGTAYFQPSRIYFKCGTRNLYVRDRFCMKQNSVIENCFLFDTKAKLSLSSLTDPISISSYRYMIKIGLSLNSFVIFCFQKNKFLLRVFL